jgi:hypothetical protein
MWYLSLHHPYTRILGTHARGAGFVWPFVASFIEQPYYMGPTMSTPLFFHQIGYVWFFMYTPPLCAHIKTPKKWVKIFHPFLVHFEEKPYYLGPTTSTPRFPSKVVIRCKFSLCIILICLYCDPMQEGKMLPFLTSFKDKPYYVGPLTSTPIFSCLYILAVKWDFSTISREPCSAG